ncbi:hypothetical protein BJ875DRAFT_505880 [Amylocarpus encephaloides]|uniref:Enoyl reductase (ER) domain-containing protein n=1 Tax=Amylocarpus encephaloides TaxID=45428 RepID=A0A9P7YG61_9HELO|nr:hypothetical protein BJ875DRAFT_505880 [Amylocarpus encephaloides]
MHQAQVTTWGHPPTLVTLPDPPLPSPDSDTIQLHLLATGLHRVVRSRASGKHFTANTLPHIPGVDGVGRAQDGKLYYFTTFTATGGSFASIINVPKAMTRSLPEGLDPVRAAALVNPSMASWMALRKRSDVAALGQREGGFTVLIVGVTTASGQIAISNSRSLGATRVIGLARNASRLATLDLDVRIQTSSVTETDFTSLGDVDIILDFIYGPLTLHLLNSLKSTVPTEYVQIGTMADPNLELPGALLRSKDITLRGSAPGAWTMRDLGMETEGMLRALVGVKNVEVGVVKLGDAERIWGRDGGERVVFVP